MVISFRLSDADPHPDFNKWCRAGSYSIQDSSCSKLACGSRRATAEELMFVCSGSLLVFWSNILFLFKLTWEDPFTLCLVCIWVTQSTKPFVVTHYVWFRATQTRWQQQRRSFCPLKTRQRGKWGKNQNISAKGIVNASPCRCGASLVLLNHASSRQRRYQRAATGWLEVSLTGSLS